MGKILVLAELHNGSLKRSSQELFTAVSKAGQTAIAAVLGSGAADAAKELGAWGAAEVHVAKDSALDKYNPELFTTVMADIVKKTGATLILSSANSMHRDLFPTLAARLDAGLISDCTDLKLDGANVTAKKPLYAGKLFAQMTFNEAPIQMVLMRANQLPVAKPASGTSPAVTEYATPAPSLATVIKEVVKGTSEKLDLTEANIIVSGGRGLKNADNFKYLNELADVLGATVGASRAVVDDGWVPHEMQVGQTGKTVAPSLYIAVGISGAIQHMAGMSGSKVIVAINTDPAAPIFQKATYGIVGDFAEIVPKLTEEFKKVLR